MTMHSIFNQCCQICPVAAMTRPWRGCLGPSATSRVYSAARRCHKVVSATCHDKPRDWLVVCQRSKRLAAQGNIGSFAGHSNPQQPKTWAGPNEIAFNRGACDCVLQQRQQRQRPASNCVTSIGSAACLSLSQQV
jgi:hypothetical protein